MPYDLAIAGAGNMAEAIVRGLIRAGAIPVDRIIAADPVEARRAVFASIGTHVTDNTADLADARVLLLATKPQTLPAALQSLRDRLPPDTLVISIAAGVSCAKIEQQLSTDPALPPRVVRSMPNTPMLVGAGAVAIAPGQRASSDDLQTARKLFETSAVVVEVKEELIDAVTALSGSGPAYVFYLVEQMTRAGIELGLSDTDAALLARRTAYGAGLMLEQSPEPADELRRRVTSPGGTTQAAIESLDRARWADITRSAIHAAQQRGRELGR